MKNYTAITYSVGAYDIGEFSSDEEAHDWARERFGEDLSAVISASPISIDASAFDPMWLVLGLLAFWFLSKKKGN